MLDIVLIGHISKDIFTKVRLQRKALSLIKPSKTDKSQTITWDHYRKLFVNKDNIDKGKRFISTHKAEFRTSP